MSLITFIAGDGAREGDEWPESVVGDGFIHLQLTHNREALDSGEATYVDGFGELYVLERLRSGQIVGEIRED